ncbi:hypothetical protein NQ318_016399 [Aromia moschata]|uniref:Uncharacterized protein n=1 Tax=Aromia moschata TaxID=1265417 RepID=A0AAV8Z590_9CUCU|nr:hypothetical protein NQ318_016399 [Aromia moschata]
MRGMRAWPNYLYRAQENCDTKTNLINTIGKGKSLSFKICPLKIFLSRIGKVLRHRRAICFEWHSGPKRVKTH